MSGFEKSTKKGVQLKFCWRCITIKGRAAKTFLKLKWTEAKIRIKIKFIHEIKMRSQTFLNRSHSCS